MNTPVRRVGLGLILLFVALTAQLTYLQVFRAETLENDPRNVRNFLRDINQPRGPIITSDGEIVARSEPTPPRSAHRRARPGHPPGLLVRLEPVSSHDTGLGPGGLIQRRRPK